MQHVPEAGAGAPEGLSPAELEAESAEALPERAAMSTLSVAGLDAATGTVEAVGDGVSGTAAATAAAPEADATTAAPEAPVETTAVDPAATAQAADSGLAETTRVDPAADTTTVDPAADTAPEQPADAEIMQTTAAEPTAAPAEPTAAPAEPTAAETTQATGADAQP